MGIGFVGNYMQICLRLESRCPMVYERLVMGWLERKPRRLWVGGQHGFS